MSNNTEKQDKILEVSRKEQYHTVEELFEHSRPSRIYYFLLGLSALIIAAGLIVQNSAIVIGGMLVAPILTPLLTIALGLSVSRASVAVPIVVLVAKSAALIVCISFVVALLLGATPGANIFENNFRSATLYFIVALASGVAATLTWIRREVANILPGVAISVALVPPLSLVGILLSLLDFNGVRFWLTVFLLNLVGILVGSFVVFTMSKFYKVEEKIAAQEPKQ